MYLDHHFSASQRQLSDILPESKLDCVISFYKSYKVSLKLLCVDMRFAISLTLKVCGQQHLQAPHTSQSMPDSSSKCADFSILRDQTALILSLPRLLFLSFYR